MAYNHGVRVKEQATSLVAPVTGTAGLQVIIGTAPVNLAADPYKATDVPEDACHLYCCLHLLHIHGLLLVCFLVFLRVEHID